MSECKTTVFDTSLGWMAAVWKQTHIRALTFGHISPHDALRHLQVNVDPIGPDRFMTSLIRRLTRLAEGECGDTFRDIRLDTQGMTEFQRRVTSICRRIPIGKTISYGQLAERAGHPGAARAVGSVMSSNRFPLIVPCHRVVSANSIGGFSSPDGLDMKRRLLAAEANHQAAPCSASRS